MLQNVLSSRKHMQSKTTSDERRRVRATDIESAKQKLTVNDEQRVSELTTQEPAIKDER